MWELAATILLRVIDFFVADANRKAALAKKVEEQIQAQEARGLDSAELRKRYEDLKRKLDNPTEPKA